MNGTVFQKNLRQIYNHQSFYVKRYVKWKLRLDPIFKHIDSAIPPEGVIVDAGCGYGIMSHLISLKSAKRKVIGVDRDNDKLRIAQATADRSPNVQFEHGDLNDWVAPRADAILLIDVLHYWSPSKQRQILKRLSESLNPRGVIIFRDACAQDRASHRFIKFGEIFTVFFGINRRGEGLHFQTGEALRAMFQDCGLTLLAEHDNWGRGSNTTFILSA